MSSDLERFRRDEIRRQTPNESTYGNAAFVGRVTTVSPVVGKFLLVNPVAVFGTETEGSVGSLAPDTGKSVPVYLVEPSTAVTGDNLICRFINHRWVAEKFVSSTSTPLPGCPCTVVVNQLHHNMTRGLLQSNLLDAGMPADCTLTATAGGSGLVFEGCINDVAWMSPPFPFRDSLGTYHTSNLAYFCRNDHIMFLKIQGPSGVTTPGSTVSFAQYPAGPGGSGIGFLSLACSPFLWRNGGTLGGVSTLSVGP